VYGTPYAASSLPRAAKRFTHFVSRFTLGVLHALSLPDRRAQRSSSIGGRAAPAARRRRTPAQTGSATCGDVPDRAGQI